jgi:hypothetical protein
VTQETGDQKAEVKLIPKAEMEKMTHHQLLLARKDAKSKEEQDHIAPFEHRAFAREYVEENPVTGTIGIGVAIPLYAGAKAAGLVGSRTETSVEQMKQGYAGISEGLDKAIVEPWKRFWNDKAVPPTTKIEEAPTGAVKPWEREWKVQKNTKPVTVGTLATEKQMLAAAELSEEERQKENIRELSDTNIQALKTELANTKDPQNRNILQTELDKILGKRRNFGRGQVEDGNINLSNRPVLRNADGTVSTIESITVGFNGVQVLIPTIIDGKRVSEKQAIEHYRKTGEHLGKFGSVKAAETFAKKLSKEQGKRVNGEER